ncbi:MAG TPA: aspartate kinase [Longilinea sp.]|nr:aspartate kinase [Longilinea sp.]
MMTTTLIPQKHETLVMKFGGTSIGTVQVMQQTVSIVAAEKKTWPNLVVITSALSGVTDTLLSMAGEAARGQADSLDATAAALAIRHAEISSALVPDPASHKQVDTEIKKILEETVNLCRAVSVLGELTPRVLDAIASAGERMCVIVLAAALQANGLDAEVVQATRLICTDDHYTDAHPDLKRSGEMTCDVLKPMLSAGKVPVITGFIATTRDGHISTLGRGGSDYSAALIGAALPADDVWIFTDVNGVMTADPRLVPDAATVPACSYREIAELAYYGAKVLHPKTIRPVIEAGIGLRVCNTFNPSHAGTRLFSELEAHPGVIKAITTIRGLQLVTLEGRGMLGVPGVAARTFDAVAKLGTSVPLITQASSEQSICFAVPTASVKPVMEKLTAAFAAEIESRDIDRVWATDEVGIVTVVGEGMRSTPGVSGRIFSALGAEKVNVVAIAQGSSEVSVSLVVTAAQVQQALQVLHRLIRQPA